MSSEDLKELGSESASRDLVVVTGAGGNLGAALTPLLLKAGYAVRLVDLMPLAADGSVEAITADLRQPAVAGKAVTGARWLVHGAAWHGIHLANHPPEDFWDLNVDATFRLYQAAIGAGVGGVVFSSSMAVYGLSGKSRDGRATRVHEDLPLLPDDIYGMSKVVGEELAATLARQRKIRTVALRFGMFVPEPFPRYGVRLLYGGVDARDVATAVLAGIDALKNGKVEFDAFNIESALPFSSADSELLIKDPMHVVEGHWPDAAGVLQELGVQLWGPIERWFDVDRAGKVLGWAPQHNFDQFLEEAAR